MILPTFTHISDMSRHNLDWQNKPMPNSLFSFVLPLYVVVNGWGKNISIGGTIHIYRDGDNSISVGAWEVCELLEMMDDTWTLGEFPAYN